MSKRPRPRLVLRDVLIGVVLGFGANLVTNSASQWWPPLQPVSRYAVVWFPALLVAVIGWEVLQRYRDNRRVTWRRDESPYPGLEPYTADRTSVFFGREQETTEIVTRLQRSGVAPPQRFIPLVGPSGSGKSSIVNAGVLPRLSPQWTVIGPVRPTANPFLALAEALPPTGNGTSDHVARLARLLRDEAAREPASTPETLLSRLMAVQARTSRLLLVVDQWEELITLAPEPERERFVRLLHAALVAHPALHVLVTVRNDFYDQFTKPPYEGLLGTPYPIGALNPHLLRDVVVKPAEAAGVAFEPGLVDTMVAEATSGDALPLLGHLLQRLYPVGASDHLISRDEYDRAGRVGGAIAEHADEVYHDLITVHEPRKVDDTLLRFVSFDGREATRRAVRVTDLDDVAHRVVDEFRAARLIVDSDDGKAFDLAHEALLRQWRHLTTLITTNESRLRQHTILEHRAQAWATSGNRSADLLSGDLLQEAEELTVKLAASNALAGFLDASRQAINAMLEHRADQVAQRAQELRNRDRSLALAVAAAGVRELAPSRTAVSTLWGLTTQAVVDQLWIGHAGRVLALAWSADDSHIVSVGDEGAVCTWTGNGELTEVFRLSACSEIQDAFLTRDATRVAVTDERGHHLWDLSGSRHHTMLTQAPHEVRWSPSGQYFACPGEGGMGTRVFRVDGSGREHEIRNLTVIHDLSGLAWSPDESMLAMVDAVGNIAITQVESGDEIACFAQALMGSDQKIAWAPDGRHLAVHNGGSNKRVRVREVVGGNVVREWNVRNLPGLGWSPDGMRLALADGDSLRILELATGKRICQVRLPSWFAGDPVWSHDGTRICMSLESRVAVVTLETGEVLTTGASTRCTAYWSPDRTQVLVRDGRSNSLQMLDARVPEPPFRWSLPQAMNVEAAWSPDGALVAISRQSVLEIWDARSGAGLYELDRLPAASFDEYRWLAWSPDGRYLAARSMELSEGVPLDSHVKSFGERIKVWDVARQRAVLGMPVEPGDVRGRPGLEWSPDGTLLLRGERGKVVTFRALTGDVVAELAAPSGRIAEPCWSPDQKVIAGVCIDHQVRIWDSSTGEVMASCIGHSGEVERLRWSPDGQFLASASDEGNTVRLWRPNGSCVAAIELPELLRDDQFIVHLGWSVSGDQITVTTNDLKVWTWTLPTDPEAVLARAAEVTDRVLTVEERRRYDLPVD